MAGRRIYSQLFVGYSASVPADEQSQAVALIIIFCNFIHQQLRADDFQIPPHRQALTLPAIFHTHHSNLKMKFNFFNRQIKTDKPTVEAVIDTTDYTINDQDFKFVFNDTSNSDINCPVISFGDLTKSKLSDTLTIYKNGKPLTKLDLRYYYSSSSKSEAIKFNRFVAVGLSGFFYLFDLSTKTFILFINFNGYFDEFKISEEHLFVAYNSGIYCLTKYGQIKWHNSSVGLDGIIINDIKEGKIYGSEQVDPPDGWKDFVLNFDTGNRTQ